MKKTLLYCRHQWDEILFSVWAGGLKAFILKVLLFCWLFWCGRAVYFVVPYFIAFLDLIVGPMAHKKLGDKFNLMIWGRGLLDKFFLFSLILLMVAALEFMVMKNIPIDNNWLLLVASFMISVHEIGSVSRNVLVIKPSWQFLKKLCDALGIVQLKIISKAENIL